MTIIKKKKRKIKSVGEDVGKWNLPTSAGNVKWRRVTENYLEVPYKVKGWNYPASR